VLRTFEDMDRAPLFALNTHPLVVESLGSSPTRAESDAMVERCAAEMVSEGWGLWAVTEAEAEAEAGERGPESPFVGMVGLHRVPAELPCAPAVEIGWRLHPDHWGHGYATEAAAASLRFGFEETALAEIVAFTTTRNIRSQAVMTRIGMRRDAGGDFDHPSVPDDSPLRRHVLYRVAAPGAGSQVRPTVAS
jgi:ribosomal-protein-alanine N-acetyltransferase